MRGAHHTPDVLPEATAQCHSLVVLTPTTLRQLAFADPSPGGRRHNDLTADAYDLTSECARVLSREQKHAGTLSQTPKDWRDSKRATGRFGWKTRRGTGAV